MRENIELISYYHYEKTKKLEDMCSIFGDFMDKRISDVTATEIFITMMLRAIIYSRKIVIIKPLTILDDLNDTLFLKELFDKLDRFYDDIVIYELDRYEYIYRGVLI